MRLKAIWHKRSYTFRYAAYGALFGLMFPIFATLGDIYLQGLPLTPESVWQVQKSSPLHWVIDTAPFFLGLFASFAGRRQDRLIRLNEVLEHRVQERDQAILELETLQATLERQVAQRTADLTRRTTELEAAAQVARGAAAIRDSEQLLKETVHLISDRFGFYHAGIFLLDEARQYAVLRAASSEGGGHMLARRHKLKVSEEGIVGYAAGTGEPRIALDVGEDAAFFNNPDLPMTHSEMAVPLKVHDQIIGVLDVQSTEPAAFSEEDVAILQALADQVALAIENARLFEQSQRALQDLDTLYGRRARKAWQEQVARQPAGYRYTGLRVEPSSPAANSETGTQALENAGGDQHLTAPIRLRGQSIGSIVLRQDPGAERWSSEEMALVDEVSTQIGLALENARLLEEAQRQAQREHVIREVTEQMRRAVNVETVLQTTVAKLGQVMAAPRVYVRLGTEFESGSNFGDGPASRGDKPPSSGSSQPSGDTA